MAPGAWGDPARRPDAPFGSDDSEAAAGEGSLSAAPSDAGAPGPEPVSVESVESAEAPVRRPVDERLDFRIVAAWLLSGVVGFLVLVALGVGGTQLVSEEVLQQLPWLPTAAITVVVVLGLWTLLQPWLAWRRWRFRVDAQLLSARYGIFFHEEKVIPMSRLQHVDLTRGPIERLFGLATLIVHTAGSEGATFRLPGLRDARARALREQVLDARGDDVV